MQRFTLSQVLGACHGTGTGFIPSNIQSYTSPDVAIRTLFNQGQLWIIAAPYGSPARQRLDSWKRVQHISFRQAEKARVDEKAAELEKKKPAPSFTGTSWVWLADPKKAGCEEKEITVGTLFDSVWCKVDTEGLMPGDSVTFSLYLKAREGSEKGDDFKITTLSGNVGSGRKDDAAVSRYRIEAEVQGLGLLKRKDKLYFIAKRTSQNLELKSGLLEINLLKPPFAFSI